MFNQTDQTAILYQNHSYIATKCSDMLDSILLNPGSPSDWGLSSNSTKNLAFFGLQDPQFQEYTVSSFSLMRLLSPATQQVYNSTTYNALSWGLNGGFLLLNTSQCINSSSATGLLGISGIFGFQLVVTPTLTVNVSQVLPSTDLKLQVQVHGPGFPLSNATVNYLMFWANTSSSAGFPIINSYNFTSSTLQTNSSGFGLQEFTSLSNTTAPTLIAEASAGGLSGTGYLSSNTLTRSGNLIPYINSFDNGTANVVLAQNTTGTNPLYFNASFYNLPSSFVPVQAGNFSGTLNPGGSQNLTIITSNQTGFLVVAYTDGSSNYGMVVMPVGVGTLGMSVTFGGSPSGTEWVAADLRQVLIGNIAYQAKLSLWSLQGYQGES